MKLGPPTFFPSQFLDISLTPYTLVHKKQEVLDASFTQIYYSYAVSGLSLPPFSRLPSCLLPVHCLLLFSSLFSSGLSYPSLLFLPVVILLSRLHF